MREHELHDQLLPVRAESSQTGRRLDGLDASATSSEVAILNKTSLAAPPRNGTGESVGITVCASKSRAITGVWRPSGPSAARVAFVTAAFGLYETALHEPAAQEMMGPPPSFIAFSDTMFAAHVLGTTVKELATRNMTRSRRDGSAWELDWTPYHTQLAATQNFLSNASLGLSLEFRKARWYKMQFHLVPRLRGYHWVVWMDTSIALRDPFCSHYIARGEHSLIAVHYGPRKCSTNEELRQTVKSPKYSAFKDSVSSYMRSYQLAGQPESFGMWLTCLIVYNMRHNATVPALDKWHKETHMLGNDQLTFPYVMWQHRNVLSIGSLLEGRVRRITTTNPSCYGGMPCAFIKLKHGLNMSSIARTELSQCGMIRHT